jgi:hypothetical protein
MPFVIKMTTPGNNVCWLSAAKSFSADTFGPREKAAIFKRQSDAQAVIEKLPLSMTHGGAAFAVEATD